MDAAGLVVLFVEIGGLALVYFLWRASRRTPEEIREAEAEAERRALAAASETVDAGGAERR